MQLNEVVYYASPNFAQPSYFAISSASLVLYFGYSTSRGYWGATFTSDCNGNSIDQLISMGRAFD
jgi:hypothetical protein